MTEACPLCALVHPDQVVRFRDPLVVFLAAERGALPARPP